MIKKLFILAVSMSIFYFNVIPVMAIDKNVGEICNPIQDKCVTDGYSCQPLSPPDQSTYACQKSTTIGIFGKVNPPDAIKNLGFGSQGISKFLNNLISLIYIIAAVVFIFMIIWGALEWILSGGDKEKVGNAQKRLTNALIGMVLLGVAFAIIKVVGTFTGFSFFSS